MSLRRLASAVARRASAVVNAARIAAKRRGRPLLIVHIQETGLREHIEPVVHWLADHGDCFIVIVVREAQRAAYLRQTTLPVIAEDQFSARWYRPDAVLSLHPEAESSVAVAYKGREKPYRVVMQHGLPDKESFFVPHRGTDTLSCYDAIFLFGPVSREGTLRLYAEHFPESFQRLRLYDIGCPKTDALVADGFNRKVFLEALGLDPNCKTICYAPTYQRTASLQQQGVAIIEALAALDANVIVKLHHISLKSGAELEPWMARETEGIDWRAKLAQIEGAHPNVRLALVPNANPCLMAADVLVTDVSGVAFEYLLLDRPVVFVDVPELFAEFGTEGIHYWGRACGDIVSGVRELVAATAAALANPRRTAQQREELRARLFYNPGRATETAGRTLSEILKPRRTSNP